MEKTGKTVFGLVLIAIFVFFALSVVSYSPNDAPAPVHYPPLPECVNYCGFYGATLAALCFDYFGLGTWFLLVAFAISLIYYWIPAGLHQPIIKTTGAILILIALCGGATALLNEYPLGPTIGPGGILGAITVFLLNQAFSPAGGLIFLVAILIAGLILATDSVIVRVLLTVTGITVITNIILSPFTRPTGDSPKEKSDRTDLPLQFTQSGEIAPQVAVTVPGASSLQIIEASSETIDSVSDKPEPVFLEPEEPAEPVVATKDMSKGKSDSTKDKDDLPGEKWEEAIGEYAHPPLDLLPVGTPPDYDAMRSAVEQRGRLLEKAFADFGVEVRVVETQTGPVLTLYEIELARGLRLSKVRVLAGDLEIALKAPSVRIVAPIPGKNTVGVEIPNDERQFVRLRDLMEESAELTQKMEVPVFLGRDVTGAPLIVDLTKLPHLLIAGRTGTGKSVCLNSIIMSILMTRAPQEVRLLLIDPKVVELLPYKTVPHLMYPVVTDMKKAEALLAWAVDKMEERYQLFARAGVRQLTEYNRLTPEQLYRRVKPESDEDWESIPKKMATIIIVADEMADLIMTSGKEVETHIIRLAQKSRAVGIHLVLATQKPTVDVITGLIKSNLPARIAFGVASRIDSQVVLDTKGAEQLLGNGDMLFLKPGTSQVIRGQGTYISDQEIIDIISVIGTATPDYEVEDEDLMPAGEQQAVEVRKRDDLYEACVEAIFQDDKPSISNLQRRFSIGYNRSARIIDCMVADGIIGDQDKNRPSAPREFLMTYAQWQQREAQSQQEPEPPWTAPEEPKKRVESERPKIIEPIPFTEIKEPETLPTVGPGAKVPLSFPVVVNDDQDEDDQDEIATPPKKQPAWSEEQWEKYLGDSDE